jgi:hypothetical protein
VKQFIFGQPTNHPKAKPEEKGEVIISAPSLAEARAAFVAEYGEKDARTNIVRVDPMGLKADHEITKPARRRRARA